jgi:hypothetical protein
MRARRDCRVAVVTPDRVADVVREGVRRAGFKTRASVLRPRECTVLDASRGNDPSAGSPTELVLSKCITLPSSSPAAHFRAAFLCSARLSPGAD